MRLLQLNSDGDLSLTNDLDNDDTIPPYAILSHTWGADTEEVTFEDLIYSGGKNKNRYNKIVFCREQAKRDSLQYFRSILAASTRLTKANSRMRLTLCFAGIVTQLDATST